MLTIFRREWDEGDISSWQASDSGRTPRHGIVRLWPCLDAHWPWSRHEARWTFPRLVECADQFSDNKQGNEMNNIAQGSHHRLDIPVG